MARAILTRLAAASVAACFSTTLGMIGTRPAIATDEFADASSSTVPYRDTPVTSHYLCASLVGRKLKPSARVTSATLIPKNGATGTPEFCDVDGVIGKSILFDVALPTQWNQRLYGLGNAGCGMPLAMNVPLRDAGLANGFAVAITDTGHEGDILSCQWAAYQPDLVVDFAYEGIHDAAVVAKELLHVFYAQRATFSYFDSCSDGGQDALEEAQRFPNDYDGIIAGSPSLGAGTIMSLAWTTGAFAKLPSNQQFTATQANYVASAVYAKCDGLDGLKDGIITDGRECARVFDPDRDLKRCPGNASGSNCLTAAQLAAYKKVLAPVLSHGQAFYPGMELGAEIQYAGNVIPDMGAPKQTSKSYVLSDQYMRFLFPWPQTRPNEFSAWTFDFDRDPNRIYPFRRMFDPTNLDMTPFFSGGGKLLGYHGWADPTITSYSTIAFYEDEIKLHGLARLAANYRLFMVPGMGHCFSGPGADQFDPMTKIIEWREAQTPPVTILSRHFQSTTQFGGPSGALLFTRTLCVYPEVARYAGGDPKKASSFECVQGPRGVPDTGADFGLQFP